MNIRLPTTPWDILFCVFVAIWTLRGFTKSALPSLLHTPRYYAQILGERSMEGWLYKKGVEVGSIHHGKRQRIQADIIQAQP